MASVFDFDDYVKYIRARQEALPKRGWGFVNQLADHLGINQVQVSQVLGRKKHFTLEQTVSVSEFLGLTELESDYFFNLVMKARAGSVALQKVAERKLKVLKGRSLKLKETIPSDLSLNEEQLAQFYSHYLYSAIRLFTSVDEGKTIDEITAKFNISGRRAAGILEFLVNAGLCEKKNSKYSMGARRTVVGRDSAHLVRHHLNWRMLGLERAQRLRDEDIMVTSPVSLSRSDFALIRRQINDLIHEISQRVRPSKAEMVACWNMDWFELDPE